MIEIIRNNVLPSLNVNKLWDKLMDERLSMVDIIIQRHRIKCKSLLVLNIIGYPWKYFLLFNIFHIGKCSFISHISTYLGGLQFTI